MNGVLIYRKVIFDKRTQMIKLREDTRGDPVLDENFLAFFKQQNPLIATTHAGAFLFA